MSKGNAPKNKVKTAAAVEGKSIKPLLIEAEETRLQELQNNC